MKKKRLIMMALFIALLSLVSCKKSDSQNTANNSSSISASKSDLEKKNRGSAAGYEGTPFNANAYS